MSNIFSGKCMVLSGAIVSHVNGVLILKHLNAMFCRSMKCLKIKHLYLTNLIGIENMGEDNL